MSGKAALVIIDVRSGFFSEKDFIYMAMSSCLKYRC